MAGRLGSGGAAGMDALADGSAAAGCVSTPLDSSRARIRVADYGAIPDDGVSDLAALQAALSHLKSGQVLELGAGVYDIPIADLGIALTIDGLSDVVIDGTGATLRIDGFDPSAPTKIRRVIHVWKGKSVVIQGLTIDMDRAPFSQGTIEAVTGNTMTVRFDAGYPVTAAMQIGALMQYRADGTPLGAALDDYPTYDTTKYAVRELSPQLLTIQLPGRSTLGVKVGDRLVVRHGVYDFHAFTAGYTDGLTLRDVTVSTIPGMVAAVWGVHDLTVQRLRVQPTGDRLMTSTADGIHANACTGTVTFCDSKLARMGDDALNVHGMYWRVDAIDAAKSTITVSPYRGGWFAPFRAGDTIEVYGPAFAVRGQAVIEPASVIVDGQQSIVLALDQLPTGLAVSDFFVSLTRVPAVRVSNVEVKDNRARGFLLPSRDVIVQGCTVDGSTLSGILIEPDVGDWSESLGARNVTVQDCTIRNVGFAQAMPAVRVRATELGAIAPAYVMGDLQFLRNRIDNIAGSAFDIASSTGVSLQDNILSGIGASPGTRPVVALTRVDGVTVTGNSVTSSTAQGITQAEAVNVVVTGNTGM
jgi:hypothetical protein